MAEVAALDRRRIRQVFERRFSAEVMARHYLDLYQQLAAQRSDAGQPVSHDLTHGTDGAATRFTTYVLKDGDSFIVADAAGDIEGGSDGFFHNDTRLLSRFRLRLGDSRPALLSTAVSRDNVMFVAHLTNRPLPPLGGSPAAQGVIHLAARALPARRAPATSASPA